MEETEESIKWKDSCVHELEESLLLMVYTTTKHHMFSVMSSKIK